MPFILQAGRVVFSYKEAGDDNPLYPTERGSQGAQLARTRPLVPTYCSALVSGLQQHTYSKLTPPSHSRAVSQPAKSASEGFIFHITLDHQLTPHATTFPFSLSHPKIWGKTPHNLSVKSYYGVPIEAQGWRLPSIQHNMFIISATTKKKTASLIG